MEKTIYIAGPMRGYPEFNFPAFDAARDRALALGFKVFSPADMDREDKNEDVRKHLAFKDGGLDSVETERFLCRRYAQRDVDAIFKSTHIALLPGWNKSIGAMTEFCLARWLKLEILDAVTFEPIDPAPYVFQDMPEKELV